MEWNDQMIDEALRKSAASQEKSYPNHILSPDHIWERIGNNRQKKPVMYRYIIGIAASLLMIFFIAWWCIPGNDNETVVQNKVLLPAQIPDNNKEAIAYISKYCLEHKSLCSSPTFNELRKELDETIKELTTVQQQLHLFGHDELLLRARERVKYQQSAIIHSIKQIL